MFKFDLQLFGGVVRSIFGGGGGGGDSVQEIKSSAPTSSTSAAASIETATASEKAKKAEQLAVGRNRSIKTKSSSNALSSSNDGYKPVSKVRLGE